MLHPADRISAESAWAWMHWYTYHADPSDHADVSAALSNTMFRVIQGAMSTGSASEASSAGTRFVLVLVDTYMKEHGSPDSWPPGRPGDPDQWFHDLLHIRGTGDEQVWHAHIYHGGPAKVRPAILFLTRGVRAKWLERVPACDGMCGL